MWTLSASADLEIPCCTSVAQNSRVVPCASAGGTTTLDCTFVHNQREGIRAPPTVFEMQLHRGVRRGACYAVIRTWTCGTRGIFRDLNSRNLLCATDTGHNTCVERQGCVRPVVVLRRAHAGSTLHIWYIRRLTRPASTTSCSHFRADDIVWPCDETRFAVCAMRVRLKTSRAWDAVQPTWTDQIFAIGAAADASIGQWLCTRATFVAAIQKLPQFIFHTVMPRRTDHSIAECLVGRQVACNFAIKKCGRCCVGQCSRQRLQYCRRRPMVSRRNTERNT